MEKGAYRTGLIYPVVTLGLVACFALGYAAGVGVDKPAAPVLSEAYALSGHALWETLPPELLTNVEEGIQERISELEDDIQYVQRLQGQKMGTNR